MKRLIVASVVVGTLLIASVGGAAPADHSHPSTALSAAATLHQNMRALWSDHVIWTRDYIVAAVADQPDQQAAAARLMKNQEDIGAAIAVYYGRRRQTHGTAQSPYLDRGRSDQSRESR